MYSLTQSGSKNRTPAILRSYTGPLATGPFDFSKPSAAPTSPPATLPPNPDDWQAWLAAHFAAYVRAPFAPRHVVFWSWLADLAPGTRLEPLIAAWPRGGAKSTTAELGCVYVQQRQVRRFVVYCSETQDQANMHVQNIAEALEALGVERAVNKYRHSKGWTQYLLRTSDGFNVRAFGLDAGARGVKLGTHRPDLIIFDDVDGKDDSQATTHKKKTTITQTLLPAGTADCAVLFIQNLIHPASVCTQLVEGTAGFLSDRRVSGPYPALEDFASESYVDDDGRQRHCISGTPTWDGQSLAACQALVDTIGVEAFEIECQHEIGTGRHLIYDVFDKAIHTCPRFTIPKEWPRYLGLDFGGVNTAGIFLAEEPGTKKLYGYRVYWEGDKDSEDHAKDLREGEPMVPFCVGGSKSEDQWRREFRKGGLPVREPDIAEVWIGIQRVYSALKHGELVFFDDLPHIFLELADYRRKLDASGKPTNEINEKRRYHVLDGLRYIVGWLRRARATGDI